MKERVGPNRSGVVRGRSPGVKPGSRFLPLSAVTFRDFSRHADGSSHSLAAQFLVFSLPLMFFQAVLPSMPLTIKSSFNHSFIHLFDKHIPSSPYVSRIFYGSGVQRLENFFYLEVCCMKQNCTVQYSAINDYHSGMPLENMIEEPFLNPVGSEKTFRRR